MKRATLVVFTVLCLTVLGGCKARPRRNSDNTESWEFLPFYGELRFLIVCEDTGEPIPGAVLRVPGLPIAERRDKDKMKSGQDGRVVVHQTHRRNSYRGEGPPLPTFTFRAPHYRTRILSVDDLVSGTSYNPYNGANLPTTTYRYSEKEEMELPVYELTIRLARIKRLTRA